MLVLKASWYFGVELMTFVVKRIELCRLTVAVLEPLSDSSEELGGVNISRRQPLGCQRGDR
jgi:hypothetical protein